MLQVRHKADDHIDKSLRRLKKKMDKEGILRDVRNHRYYEKPSETRRRIAKRNRIRANFY